MKKLLVLSLLLSYCSPSEKLFDERLEVRNGEISLSFIGLVECRKETNNLLLTGSECLLYTECRFLKKSQKECFALYKDYYGQGK